MTILKNLTWIEGRYFGSASGAKLLRGAAVPHPDGKRYAPDKVVDVEHIRLELSFALEEKRVDGICTTRVRPISGEVKSITMNCVELVIDAVEDGRGGALDFDHDGERLYIRFGKPLPTAAPTEVKVRYHGRPRKGLYFTAPDADYPKRAVQVWSQGQDEDSRNWFPCFDYPNEKATSETLITVPSNWTVVGNGALLSVKEDKKGGAKIFHHMESTPHVCYLISIACGEFSKIEDKWGGIPVQYFVKPGLEEDAKRAFSQTPDMLECFSRRFGLKYPYEKYAQVVVEDFIFGGMENISATTLIDRCLVDKRAALDYEPQDLVSHELAHQWFGDLLTCKDWSHAWLNEGFATYSEVIYREHWRGADDAHYHRWQAAQSYFDRDRSDRRPIVTKDYTIPMELFDQHIYEKGGCVLHMLRRVLGEADFWAVIKEYLHRFAGKTVQTEDLILTISSVTGKNLEWFFDEWLYAAGYPEFEVKYSLDEATMTASVTVDQKQKVDEKTPLFRMPVTIAFHSKKGPVEESVEVRKAHQVFTFKLKEKPLFVRFDPGSHILKSLSFKKPPAMLKEQLAKDPDFFGRAEAARGLAEEGSPESIEALGKALLKEAFWGVQIEMASALGDNGSAGARDALIAALKIKDHRARRGVARALGKFRDDAAAKALEPFAKKDPSYFVEAEALLALGSTRQERAFEALCDAVKRDSHMDVIRECSLLGLARLRDDRAFPILKRYAKPGGIFRSRGAAMAAMAQLAKGREALKDDIRRELETYLYDRDFFGKIFAMAALEGLGEAAAIPEIERVRYREPDGRIFMLARDAAKSLREGATRGEEVNALRKDLEKFRDESRDLKDRLDKLEKLLPKSGEKKKPASKKKAVAKKKTAPKKKVAPKKK